MHPLEYTFQFLFPVENKMEYTTHFNILLYNFFSFFLLWNCTYFLYIFKYISFWRNVNFLGKSKEAAQYFFLFYATKCYTYLYEMGTVFLFHINDSCFFFHIFTNKIKKNIVYASLRTRGFFFLVNIFFLLFIYIKVITKTCIYVFIFS